VLQVRKTYVPIMNQVLPGEKRATLFHLYRSIAGSLS
jgi:hypothetical protein